MQSMHTQYDIETFLYEGITHWLGMDYDSFSIDTQVHPLLHNAFRTQLKIGWEDLLHGFLDARIIEFQHRHYTDIGSRKQGIDGVSNSSVGCGTLSKQTRFIGIIPYLRRKP